MFESKYSKFLTIILVIVIVAIVALLGFFGVRAYKESANEKNKDAMMNSFETEVSSKEDDTGKDDNENTTSTDENDTSIDIDTLSTETTNSAATSDVVKKPPVIDGFTTVGTIKIPSINCSLPIISDVTSKALDKGAVLLYPSYDYLNAPGNVVIIGHNYRNGKLFSNVKKLKIGSSIIIKDYKGTSVTYKVYNMTEASAEDTSFYSRDTGGAAEITLSTCTDASNDQRTIVFAKQAE